MLSIGHSCESIYDNSSGDWIQTCDPKCYLMKTILFPILPTILSLTTLLPIQKVSASPKCIFHQSYYHSSELNICQQQSHSLTSQKWRRLLKRYYRTRYRTQFKANNSFLSLKEVSNLLGFVGTRDRVTKENYHQYISWEDPEDSSKKIEAVFIYNRLVGLRSKGFDRSYAQQLKIRPSMMNDL